MDTPSFKYITKAAFRASLESDYQEMLKCFEAGAWKAVLVLSGSIIEAVLVDALIADGHVTEKKGLEMDLAPAIAKSEEKGIITERTANLCTVVRDYRNLIHAGKVVRQNESVDRRSASIAKELVGIVLSEVEASRTEKYGYTAEQIILKIKSDAAVDHIIGRLLASMNVEEKARLALEMIPDAYNQAVQDNDQYGDTPFYDEHHVAQSLEKCFNLLFLELPETVKRQLVAKFGQMIRESSRQEMVEYGCVFFKAWHLRWADEDDLSVVKDHFLGVLGDGDYDLCIYVQLEGIGEFLLPSEVKKFVDPLISVVFRQLPISKSAGDRIASEYVNAPASGARIDEKILERLEAWLKLSREKKYYDRAAMVEEILAQIRPIPF